MRPSSVPIFRAVSRFGCGGLARWVRGVARSELVENYVLRQVWAPVEVLFLGEKERRLGENWETGTDRN